MLETAEYIDIHLQFIETKGESLYLQRDAIQTSPKVNTTSIGKEDLFPWTNRKQTTNPFLLASPHSNGEQGLRSSHMM